MLVPLPLNRALIVDFVRKLLWCDKEPLFEAAKGWLLLRSLAIEILGRASDLRAGGKEPWGGVRYLLKSF